MSTPRRPPQGARADLGLATYQLLLTAYPPAFRAAYGREMTQLFRDQRRAAARGGRPALGLWAAVVWDVARSAPTLRLDTLHAWWSARRRDLRRDLRRDRGHGPQAGSRYPNHPPLEGGTMQTRRTVAGLAVFGGLYELANTGAEVRAGYQGPTGGWALAVAFSFVVGALLLAAGVALLRRGPAATRLARGAAFGCLVLVVGLQVVFPFMSVFARLLGIAVPVALLLAARRGPPAPAVA